jgi:plastocyanin
MKKAVLPIIILAVAIGLGYSWILIKMPSTQKTATPQTSRQATPPMDSSLDQPTVVSTSPTALNGANAKPALPAIEYVEIANSAFVPESVTIKKGTVVKWTNDDTAQHTVTSDDAYFQSPALNQTDGFTFTFDQPGTYTYHCSIHPSMHGTVIVTD